MPEPAHPPPFTTSQKVYLWLAAVASTCLVVADIVGVKLFTFPMGFSVHVPWESEPIRAVTHTCGMLTFPVTFIVTDVLNEFYGKRAARQVVYLCFAMALLAFVVLNIAQEMPWLDAPYNVREDAFNHIFGGAKIMYVASLSAYLVGSIADIVMFAWIKWATRGRFVWLRATGSTVVSQFIDSFVVSYIAFSLGRRVFPGSIPPADFVEVLRIAGTGYMLKFVLAIAATPLIYLIKAWLSRALGMTPLAPERAIG
ncbi:MAG: queuosine precursor transporter [Phycisphaerales bacterium]